jgi:dolichol-phosphate mannosyltransferase
LRDAGHEAEVVLAMGPGDAEACHPTLTVEGARLVVAEHKGLAAAAIAGIDESSGDVVVVVDPTMGYEPADVVRLIAPLLEDRADLVVASRCLPDSPASSAGRDRLRSTLGRLTRSMTGTTDPFSGLIGMSRAAVDRASEWFQPIGPHFSFELLAKVGGRWAEVPVSTGPTRDRSFPGLDEVRHLKRLADHRFGNLSRLLQFCCVGASGMVVDLSFYALFQWLFRGSALAGLKAPIVGGPLDLAVAGALAIGIALTWNFLINRRLTFSDARAGSILKQFFVYALSNALGITLSLSLRLLLPRYVGFFHDHKLMAAVVGIVTATGVTFTMARWLVFNPQKAAEAREAEHDRRLRSRRPGREVGSRASTSGGDPLS